MMVTYLLRLIDSNEQFKLEELEQNILVQILKYSSFTCDFYLAFSLSRAYLNKLKITNKCV